MAKKIAIILISFIIMVTGGFWPVSADAEEYSCQIKAERDNYYLYVRDFDRDGNPTKRVVFRGWLMQGRTITIKSLSGLISIDFKADSAKRGSGSNEFRCRRNQTFRLQ